MADLFENPIGLDGFEFLEFTAPKKGILEPIFEAMGFTLVARHKSKDVELWRQGDINLLSNYEKKEPTGCTPIHWINCFTNSWSKFSVAVSRFSA